LLIRKDPFSCIVHGLTANITHGITKKVDRWTSDAIQALQEASEAYIAAIFEDSNLVCIHSKRVTVKPKDMQLIQRIRGETSNLEEQEEEMKKQNLIKNTGKIKNKEQKEREINHQQEREQERKRREQEMKSLRLSKKGG